MTITFVRCIFGVLAIAAAACAPTYAPPIRTPHMGAPGRVAGGDVELGGGAGGVYYPPPSFGGPSIAVGVSDRWAVEAGGEFHARQWALGFVGGRVTGRVRTHGRLVLVGDAEVGGGAGAGGTACRRGPLRCTVDTENWHRHAAGGAYVGFGGALRWRIPSLWLRARTQLTGAAGIPATSWNSMLGGIEFAIGPAFALWVGYGIAGYANRTDSRWGPVFELGGAVKLGRGVRMR